MSRSKILCLLGGLIFLFGMSPNGCQPNFGIGGRTPPVIIPSTPAGNSFLRSFTVDLRGYPETDTITWDFGDGSSMPNMSLTMGRSVGHQYTRNGTFNVSVHLFDAANPFAGKLAQRIATGSIPITVTGPNQNPTASFVFSDTLDDTGAAISLSKSFDASTSRDPDGSIVKYEWVFGDGESDQGRTVDHAFSRSGRYSVRLTVTDNQGGTASASRTVAINSLPNASFTATATSQDGLTFRFDAGASSDDDGQLVGFAWDFGDGTTGAGQVVTHTYRSPGDYLVRLTVSDEFGASRTTTQTIDVTGIEVFVRSVTPAFGQTNRSVNDIEIDGENFAAGAVVELESVPRILGSNVRVQNSSTILFNFDLSGVQPGDYTLRVTNTDNSTADLVGGFRVVTPDRVRLETSLGDIVFDLVEDAPITTANFLQYVEDGFYDGTIFHRVVPGFVVQGGGFLPGNVQPPGLRPPIQNEFSRDRSNLRATVAMAKVGGDPNSATSQFFINLDDNSDNLDNQNGGFTVFANVVEGMDVADDIADVPLSGETPIEDVILIRARRE